MAWLRGTTFILAVFLVRWGSAAAQDADPGEDRDHHDVPLHFSHPLIGESISPDTKLRLDYFFNDLESDRVKHHTLRLEGEYAFAPGFSIEVNLPYTVARQSGQAERAHSGSAELAFKFANFALANDGVVLGYGAEFGLPTGNDAKGIGSDHVVQVEPFARVGYVHGGLEVTGFAGVEFQLNGRDSDSLETVVAQTVSVLYHVTPRVQGLLELDGETPFGSDLVLNVSPGLKLRPFGRSSLLVGVGAGFPITGPRELERRVVVSAFYHF